jgi:hypothetical protein
MKKLLLLFTLLGSGIVAIAQTSCATATTITTNGTLSFASYTASTFTAGCFGSTTGIKARWYKYTPTANGEITISSNLPANNGTTYTDDTRLSVFTGTSCTALTCVDANDDTDTNYLSELTVPVAAGTTYYIQWDNYWYAGAGAANGENLGLQFSFNFVATPCVRPGAADFYLPDGYTTTSADLYWNQAIGAPSNYDTDWSTNFDTPAGSGTLVTASSLFAGPPAYATTTISGIPASSNVRYYVRSNCGATQSAWQGPFFAYLAKTLPYAVTFDDPTLNYTDGFVGFSRLTTSATSTPPNYADGGAGTAMYTFNSTTAASDRRAYTRALSLQAGEVVTFSFKTRLYTASTTSPASPMSFNVTVGDSQSATGQATVLQNFTESSATGYTSRSVTYTAPTAGIYHFGFHNNTAAGATATFLFFDTLNLTSTLSNDSFLASNLSVYPNPASSVVKISNTLNAIVNTVEIADLNGRIVKTQNVNATEAEISINDLSAGVYMLKVTTDQGTATKKIVKQ